MGSSVISKPKLDYAQSINKTVEPKSNQAVMGRFELYPLWCTKVKGNAEYSEGLVECLLERHIQRRRRSFRAMQPVRKKCAAVFLVDRIRFQGYKFKRWVSYREILNFQIYTPLPHVFVLFLIDRKTFHRSYQSFECVYPEDIHRLKDFMDQIMQDPQRMVESDSTEPRALFNESLITPHWMYRNPALFQADFDDKENDYYEETSVYGSNATLNSSRTELYTPPPMRNGNRMMQACHDYNDEIPCNGASYVYPQQAEWYGTKSQLSDLPVARRLVASE